MLPAMLTAVFAALGPSEIGPTYGPDLEQTVQTVIIPAGSQWKINRFISDGWHDVPFEGAVFVRFTEDKNLSGPLKEGGIVLQGLEVSASPFWLTPAAGPVRIDYLHNYDHVMSGTCWTERNRLMIYVAQHRIDKRPTYMFLVLEREKP